MKKEVRQTRSKGRDSYPDSSGCKDSKHLLKQGQHGRMELIESRRKKDFFIKPKYQNSLPDVPCEPKHLLMPLNTKVFDIPIPEMRHVYEQQCLIGGNTVDLIGTTHNWKLPDDTERVDLDSKDLILLEDGGLKEDESTSKRSKAHKTAVAWLRRTEYLTPELAKFKTQHGKRLECQIDKTIGKKLENQLKLEEFAYLTNQKARIKIIETSFDTSLTPIMEHPSKPGVYPVEVIPVFPENLINESTSLCRDENSENSWIFVLT